MKPRHLLASLALGTGMILAMLWLLNDAARADPATLYVAPTGVDVPDCSQPGQPCRTVQHAVDQATDGDTIKVATGHYNDIHTRTWAVNSLYPYSVTAMVFISKHLAIQGGYTTANWDVADPQAHPTILDAENRGRVIYVTQDRDLTVEGLRIVNGVKPDEESDAPAGGGAIGVEKYNATGRLVVRDCEMLSNTANTGSGGTVYWWGGGLLIENSRIVSNTADDGGGIYARLATVTLTHNLFQGNAAEQSGGGAKLYECSSYIAYNTFQENTTGDSAGGLFANYGDLLLTHNDFLNNVADDTAEGDGGIGGGFYGSVSGAGYAYTITHNLFQGNVASLNGDGSGGGVILWANDGGQLVFSHNRVLNNFAATCGLPDGWTDGRGGGVDLYADHPMLISDNVIQGNWAAIAPSSRVCTGVGGGLHLRGLVHLERNLILDNRASKYPDWKGYFPVLGGGVFIHPNATVTMTNNVLARNRHFEVDDTLYKDTHTDGAAIYLGGHTCPTDTRLILLHNTIVGNASPAVVNESATLTMSHNIFSGHDTDLKMETCRWCDGERPPVTVADYTLWWPSMTLDIQLGTFTHDHDFTGDPAFVAAAANDYHLRQESQAIDRGPGAGVAADIDGHPRPIGPGYDLGADEYVNVDLSSSTKSASPQEAGAGDTVTFTIVLRNRGNSDAPNTILFDAIPISTTYVSNSVDASSGTATDGDGIGWTGTVFPGQPITVTFQVTVDQAASIQNTAIVTDAYGTVHRLVALVNPQSIYLPLIVRNYAP